MSGIFMHNSSEIFEHVESFNAGRWLAADAKSLDQWLVTFSKGPRSCLGVNLAWCGMDIAFATMLRSENRRYYRRRPGLEMLLPTIFLRPTFTGVVSTRCDLIGGTLRNLSADLQLFGHP